MKRRDFITLAGAVAFSWLPLLAVRAGDRVIKIVALGDSLTAGRAIPAGYRFTDQLEFALRAKGQSAAIINAGVGGDTAARGLARLHRSVPDDTEAVILELGANDMLGGFDPSVTRTALVEILRNLEARRIAVLLCGVRTRTTFGDEYKSAFAAMFSSLASEHNVLFYPAFDEAFVDDAQLKLSDGLHPNAAGIEAVVTRILPKVEALIDRARRKDR